MEVIRTQEGSETWESPEKLKQGDIKYYVLGPCTKSAAIKAVWEDAPEEYGKLSRSSIRFDSVDDDGNYEISVVYEASNSSSNQGDLEAESSSTMSFESSTGYAHIVKARAQSCIYGGYKPNGFIGWNGKVGEDSDIDGVDIVVASMRETYTKKIPVDKLTTAYRRKVGSMVGTVNKSDFKGWKEGELLFTSVSFSADENAEEVVVSFQFAIQVNETVKTDDGKEYPKLGHQYMSVITKTGVAEDGEMPTVTTQAVFLNDIYKYTDFNELGI